MVLERVPFQSKYLEGEGFWKDEDKESKPMSLRINKAEREQLERLKNIFSFSQDAKIIKLALDVLENVTHSTFGSENMRYLTSDLRRKPVLEDVKKSENS